MAKKKKPRSSDQVRQAALEAQNIVRGGATIGKACAQTGITYGQYGRYVGKGAKAPKTTEHDIMPSFLRLSQDRSAAQAEHILEHSKLIGASQTPAAPPAPGSPAWVAELVHELVRRR